MRKDASQSFERKKNETGPAEPRNSKLHRLEKPHSDDFCDSSKENMPLKKNRVILSKSRSSSSSSCDFCSAHSESEDDTFGVFVHHIPKEPTKASPPTKKDPPQEKKESSDIVSCDELSCEESASELNSSRCSSDSEENCVSDTSEEEWQGSDSESDSATEFGNSRSFYRRLDNEAKLPALKKKPILAYKTNTKAKKSKSIHSSDSNDSLISSDANTPTQKCLNTPGKSRIPLATPGSRLLKTAAKRDKDEADDLTKAMKRMSLFSVQSASPNFGDNTPCAKKNEQKQDLIYIGDSEDEYSPRSALQTPEEKPKYLPPKTPKILPPKTPKLPPKTPIHTSTPTVQSIKNMGRTPASVKERASFNKNKEECARRWLAEFNLRVFDGQLPDVLEIRWNPRLMRTAGQCVYWQRGEDRKIHIELSTKAIDSEYRLQKTLLHECCHAAQFWVDKEMRPPHGPAFKRWGAKASRVYPTLQVSTCHSYEIYAPHRYKCAQCNRTESRHSKSIGPDKICRFCSGKIVYDGKYAPDGTPIKSRQSGPTEYNRFVKERMSTLSKQSPGVKASALMAQVAGDWKEEKAKRQGLLSSGSSTQSIDACET
eukprot:Platyproteum_vivax@DN6347_c0_g1_i1.p1